jgi:hypothetical protein
MLPEWRAETTKTKQARQKFRKYKNSEKKGQRHTF